MKFFSFLYRNEHLASYALVAHETRAETHVGFYVKYPLLLPNFNQMWNISTILSKSLQFQGHLNNFSIQNNGQIN
jgi:hypothetical protein